MQSPTYDWNAEKSLLLQLMKQKIFEPKMIKPGKHAPWAHIEDPFTKTITLKCCKDEFDIPVAVWQFLQHADPKNPQHLQHTMQTFELLSKHAHLNPCTRKLQYQQVPDTELIFCISCKKHPPFPAFLGSLWQHECKANEWAINWPNKIPSARWHMQAQCWVFTYSYHNHVDMLLRQVGKEVRRDIKNHCWLVSDSVAQGVFANVKRWLTNFNWLQNTKRAAPAQRQQISMRAMHAETILARLPQDELKTLIRKTHMKLHPDRGGSHDEFVKFKLALEGWEKEK